MFSLPAEKILVLQQFLYLLGATSIDKISEVRLSNEIGEGEFEILKKQTF